MERGRRRGPGLRLRLAALGLAQTRFRLPAQHDGYLLLVLARESQAEEGRHGPGRGRRQTRR